MAAQSRNTLKSYFETGDQPTQANFSDLIDSMTNLTDDGTTGANEFVRKTGPTLAGLTSTDHIDVGTAGKGVRIKEGSNARMGLATLVGGTVTVNTTAVGASSRIFLSIQSLGTVSAPKAIGVTARVNGTSFTISSADATDTSSVAWMIVDPAP